MITIAVKITIRIPYAQSLKEKRQVAKSLIARTRNKFNVSIAEVAAQDIHQTLILGAALVSCSHTHAQNMLDEMLRFLELHLDGDILSVERMS